MPARITISTDAQPFAQEVLLIRRQTDVPQDRRMLVNSPTVEELLAAPLNPELNPTGGLQ
jgi:hypothetical protein